MSEELGGIYLDNNATTRPFPEVVEAMAHHFYHSFGNPGSRHAAGRDGRTALEDARESIAEILGAKPSEVVFTSGGTESTNLAILGLTQCQPGTIALTRGEHPATLESCRHLQDRGWKLHWLEIDSEGRLIPEQYDHVPWDELKLATVIYAHNETGVIQDIQPLAARCRQFGVPLHVDAVQAVGKIPVNFHDLGATTLSLGAHKFHGPRGIGALLVREGTRLAPVLFGGHQEAERRPGTEPVALAVGMARALEMMHHEQQQRMQQVQELRDRLQGRLEAECNPTLINGSLEERLPNTLNIAFPGVDGEALLVALDLEGIACSLGSTCASGSTEPAPVLLAMNRPEEVYGSSVRFSLSVDHSAEDIDAAAERIARVVRRLRSESRVPSAAEIGGTPGQG